MEIDIHPLQQISVDLLRSLSTEMNLPVTKAMLAVLNGYYPSVMDILGTLEEYKNKHRVAEFVQTHSDLISEARNTFDTSKNGISDNEKTSSCLDRFDIFVDAYNCMKSISIKEIEEALSKELSRICGEELILIIQSIQETDDPNYKSAGMKVLVVPRSMGDLPF